MGDYEALDVEHRNGVAWVTLNRPDVHNAVNDQMSEELRTLWAELRHDESVGCVVLTGAGEKAFTTGRDRSEALGRADSAKRAGFGSSAFHFDGQSEQIGPKSADLWVPVIVAVNGMACGNAFFLIGEADIVIASETATFFDPHVTFGLSATFESVQMAHRMPFGEISRIALLGAHERLSAKRAFEIGLVSEVTAPDQLLDRATWMAEAVASQPRLPVQSTVRSLWMARELSRKQSLDMGWAMVAIGNDPAEREAGLRAFGEGKRVEWQLR